MSEIDPSTHTIDKTEFGDGPWMAEPDYRHWVDEDTGLDCLIVRNQMGALCGYVGVPEHHVLFGMDYPVVAHEFDAVDRAAHGGLTYSSHCAGHICHDSPNRVWWLGFDCGHCDDYSPGMRRYRLMGIGGDWEVYRDFAYVQERCRRMASAISRIG